MTETRRKLIPALVVCCCLAGILAGGCGSREEAVARIDGTPIGKKELRQYLRRYRVEPAADRKAPAAPAPAAPPEERIAVRAALEQLINEELLLLEARQRGFIKKGEKDPAKRQAAVRRMLTELGREVPYPTLAEARKYFDQHPREFKSEARFRLEHLIFTSESEARRVRAEIKRGRLSLAAAGEQGLGGARVVGEKHHLVTAREFSPEIAKFLPDLETGRVSPVITTPFGYHLIEITERRPAGPIPFAEVENRIKDSIFARRLRTNFRQWLNRQKHIHQIEIFPEKLANL